MLAITINNDSGMPAGQIELASGANLMRAFVEEGVDGINGDCSGCMSCGTCLIRLPAEEWAKLPAASGEERALLEAMHGKSDADGWRLSCQLHAPEGVSELTVIIAEDDDVF